MSESKAVKFLNLALQGGGAHGAYTWGVLDRLLEEEDIKINGISGTSAGAMNAAALSTGYRTGGRDGAKAKLREFWWEVSLAGAWSPIRASPLEEYQNHWNLDGSLNYQIFDALSRMFSPYQTNPFNLHPLRGVLDRVVDLEVINAGGEVPLFITATSVHTGQARIFHCDEITADVLIASACIPFYFQSVVIDDEPYWDGGYMGNPSIWPLIYHTHVHDILLIQINPIYRNTTPKSSQEIINRLNEISFNASLVSEMRAINFVKHLIAEGKLSEDEYKNINMHMIPAPDVAYGLNASSKMNTDWLFFEFMHSIGRSAAQKWLEIHKHAIGHHGTVDIDTEFLGKGHEDTHEPHKNPMAKKSATALSKPSQSRPSQRKVS